MAEPVFSRITAVLSTRNSQTLAGLGIFWLEKACERPNFLATSARGRSGHMRDEVDRLVSAWKRERPDLDFSPLEVLSRITRIARHLDIARRNAFGDLETWGFDVLASLRRSGDPYQLSPGQLMQETLVTSGTMTNRLDRLEELELITRRTDPSDGRGSLVTLTKSGMRAVDSAMEELLQREREFLISLTKAERTQLAAMLSGLAGPFDSEGQ